LCQKWDGLLLTMYTQLWAVNITGLYLTCNQDMGVQLRLILPLSTNTMNREEAIKMVIETKAISAFTRNFVEWLYRNGGSINKPLSESMTKHIKKYDKVWKELAKK